MKNKSRLVKLNFIFAFVLLSLFITLSNVFAVTAYPYKSVVTQPDGSQFYAYQKGDEYFSYYEDDKGNIIAKDEKDDKWKYVINESGKLALKGAVSNGKALSGLKSEIIKVDIFSSDAKKKEYLKLQGENGELKERKYADLINLNTVPIAEKSKTSKTLKDSNSTLRELPMVVIDVSFQDIQTENTEKWYDAIYNDPDGIRAYYKEVSNNKFTVGPVKETNTSNPGVIKVKLDSDHGNWGNDLGTSEHTEVMQNIITKASAEINFEKYDLNKDGIINNNELAVVFIFAGYEAAIIDPEEPNYWASQMSYGLYGLEAGNTSISNFVGFAEKIKEKNDPKESMNGTATLCHELGHYIGLPDLYDTEYSGGEWSDLSVEYSSLMCSGNWCSLDRPSDIHSKFIPSHLDAWSKLVLGFYDYKLVEKSGKYKSIAASDSENYNMNIIPTNDENEFFIIENRQFKNFDRALGVSYEEFFDIVDINGGIIIWHIDNDILSKYLIYNTVNVATHAPGVMPVFNDYKPSSSFSSPFWDKSRYENTTSELSMLPDLFLNGSTRNGWIKTGIKVNTNVESGDVMEFSVTLPNAKVNSITAGNKNFNSKGGKSSFKVKGKNFYSDMIISVFDENGNRIEEDWANKTVKKDDETNITSRNATINFPENTTKENMKYNVKASFDNGKSYSKVSCDVTIKTSYKQDGNNNGQVNKDEQKSDKSKLTNSADTSDDESMNLWLILLGASAVGIIGVVLKLRHSV